MPPYRSFSNFSNLTIIEDKYGRSFRTLRVSLLSKCNLGCVYCTMGDGQVQNAAFSGQEHLDYSQLLHIIRQLHETLQLRTIRLTGGEPLLYHNLVPVIEGITKMGIPGIKLTTNGFLLEKLAMPMKLAGMRSVNVSLDAIDEDVFFLMSRRTNVQRVVNGIDAAIQAGLEVKINAVIMKGINSSEVLPLLNFAFERNLVIRFLEVMPMGHLYHQPKKYLFSQDELLQIISSAYDFKKLEREQSSTSNYWQTNKGVFGIIANESEPFCSDCNRLRLDSEGNIFGCLSSNHPISLKNVKSEHELQQKLNAALLQKQPLKFTGSNLSMMHIGG